MLDGGFGRSLKSDFVFQAVAIATQAAGLPAQLIWTGVCDDSLRIGGESGHQIEGEVIITALDHGIEVQRVGVVQGNFHVYPLPRMVDVPTDDTHIVRSEASPNGVGEVALPAGGWGSPTRCSRLTGQHLRSLAHRPD